MAEEQNKSKSNYFEFWKKNLGKEITIFTHDNKKGIKGRLIAVLVSHMNIILETETDYLIFRGQAIHHVAIPKGNKNE